MDTSIPHTSPLSFQKQLFRILRDNLVSERPEYADREVILCPLCRREMRFEDVESLEHILPQKALKDDPPYVSSMSLSQRAGLTVLCRTPRRTGCGKDAPQGCNGWKGQIYDQCARQSWRGPAGESPAGVRQ